MKLIDADTVVTIEIYDDIMGTTDTKKMTIADAIDDWSDEGCPPTVDAVEVVRCKDCRYYESENHNCVDEMGYARIWNGDDYCSFAERREDGNSN